MSGYADTLPKIKSLHFKGDAIELFLADGRIISAPLSKFPAIKKLSPAQRKKYHIMGGVGFDFDASDEVYHISEFLGENNSLPVLENKIKPYSHHSHPSTIAAESETEYKVRKKKLVLETDTDKAIEKGLKGRMIDEKNFDKEFKKHSAKWRKHFC